MMAGAFGAYAQGDQQAVTVSGQVLASDEGGTAGEALPGVSISIKGTSEGTVTDTNGHYTLQVPSPESVLVFSFIGYATQELRVGQQSTLNVTLAPDVATLSEVVIVGAVVKKSDLTGAVTGVDGAKLKEVPTTSMTQAMQGRMAGVLITTNPQPGANSTIKIRGNNSLQFGNNPIFVVDGLIIDGALNTINPNDIASIDVLKDASATALYGSRGANGVVIVTTKKGQKGEAKITYDGWVGVQEFSRTMPKLSAQDLYNLRVDARANQFMDNNPTGNRQDYINNVVTAPGGAFADYELDTYRSGKSYNWLDPVTRTGTQHNHTIAFSKGTNDGSYYVSFNYTGQNGLIKNAGYQRYGGKLNLEQNVKKWLKIGTNTTFSRAGSTYADSSVFAVANQANPFQPVNDTVPYLSWAGSQSQDLYNPLRSLHIQGDGVTNRLMTSNYLSATILPGLIARSTFSVDAMERRTFWYTPNDIGQAIREGSRGKAQQRNDHWLNWQWDNTLTYDKRIAEDHNFSFLAGFSVQKNDWNYNQVDAMGFANNLRGYKNLGAAFLKDKFNLASDFTTNTLVSYLGRVNYSYKGRYFATVTTRFDASSRFGPGHKSGTFPSVALGWNLAEESFMKDLNFDLLKIRVGYGVAGNQNIPNQAYQTLYSSAYTNNSVTYNVYDGRQGNPNLRWERQKQLNIGVDFGILNDRVTFSADYFHIENSGLLMKQTLSPTSGFNYTINNVGTMTNKGLEFAVNAQVLDVNDFRWSVSANLSSARNKITKLYGDVNAIYNKGGYTGVEIQREGNFFVGQSVNSIYVMKFDKIAQQSDMDYVSTLDLGGRSIQPGDIMPKDVNGDHVIDVNDRVVVGRKDPKFYGGFTTDFSWKNFSLNAIFTYNYGSKRINYLYESLMSGNGITNAHTDELDRWTPTHTNTNIPRAYIGGSRYGVGDTDWSVQNSSFLRLSTLTLAYTLPEASLGKIGMRNLRIYVTGSNVFLVTKYKGYDPEVGDVFPMSRMFVTGVNFSF